VSFAVCSFNLLVTAGNTTIAWRHLLVH